MELLLSSSSTGTVSMEELLSFAAADVFAAAAFVLAAVALPRNTSVASLGVEGIPGGEGGGAIGVTVAATGAIVQYP